VILNTKFIRACGSVFGIFLPVAEIEAFKELVSLEKTTKSSINVFTNSNFKNHFHRTLCLVIYVEIVRVQ